MAIFLSTLKLDSLFSVLLVISFLSLLLLVGLLSLLAARIRTHGSKPKLSGSPTTASRRVFFRRIDPLKLGIICLLTCIGTIVYVRYAIRTQYVYVYDNVRVDELANGGWNVLLSHLDGSPMDPDGHKQLWRHICPDYPKPHFVVGLHLQKAIFLDVPEDNCQSLNPNKHAGYYTVGDEHGNDVIQ